MCHICIRHVANMKESRLESPLDAAEHHPNWTIDINVGSRTQFRALHKCPEVNGPIWRGSVGLKAAALRPPLAFACCIIALIVCSMSLSTPFVCSMSLSTPFVSTPFVCSMSLSSLSHDNAAYPCLVCPCLHHLCAPCPCLDHLA